MSDAAPAGKQARQPTENATKPDDMASGKPAHDKSAEAQAANTADSERKPAETAGDQTSKPATTASEAVKPHDPAGAAREKPADTAQTVTPAPADMPVPATSAPLKDDLKSDVAKTADPAAALKRSGQIAVFVSRKDSKLYVRQNFSPLFDMPVTIAADERPLGTHIFTAQVDNNDTNVLHWSVVSLPFSAKSAPRRAQEERSSRGRKHASAAPIEPKPLPVPDSPTEALDRLSLPAEVMARIYEAVSTGGSIIVSDQGILAGETGEGTDFIVSLH
jgi:hypothetical protein